MTFIAGAILPLINHGLPCMSMGFLIPSTTQSTDPSSIGDNTDTPIVWRGLMVQKAVQQLLFDVDWSKDGQGLDILVIDMPPGTGDVPLTLGQLVIVDGSCHSFITISFACYPIRRCRDSFNAPRCRSFGCEKKHCNAEKSICSGTASINYHRHLFTQFYLKFRLRDLF